MELYLIVAYLVRRFAFQTGTTEADMQIWLSRGSMASFDERVLDYTSLRAEHLLPHPPTMSPPEYLSHRQKVVSRGELAETSAALSDRALFCLKYSSVSRGSD